jgi:uncharacterized protein YbaP (TraB family)
MPSSREPARLARFLRGAILLACAAHAPAQEPPTRPASRPFLWRVESEGAEKQPAAWLLGTVHLGDPRVVDLPVAVRNALAGSDVVLTEVALAGPGATSLMRRRILPDRKRLRDVLPAPLFAQLAQYLEAKGKPAIATSRLKIWAVVLELLSVHAAGVGAGPSLDLRIVNLALEQGKETDHLESMDEQVAVFDALTEDEQAELLQSALAEVARLEEQGRNATEDMIRAWLSGRESEMLRILSESPELQVDPLLRERYLDLLLTDRNQHLADRIHAKIRANPDRVLFFAVGVFHFFGEGGLLARLREKGCEVARVPADGAAAARIQQGPTWSDLAPDAGTPGTGTGEPARTWATSRPRGR